jgi:hypothetical protein
MSLNHASLYLLPELILKQICQLVSTLSALQLSVEHMPMKSNEYSVGASSKLALETTQSLTEWV